MASRNRLEAPYFQGRAQPTLGAIFQANAPSQTIRDGAHDRQAQPSPLVIAAAVEPLEEPLTLGLVDTRPLVFD